MPFLDRSWRTVHISADPGAFAKDGHGGPGAEGWMALGLAFEGKGGCPKPGLAVQRPGAALNGFQGHPDMGLLRVNSSVISLLLCQQVLFNS